MKAEAERGEAEKVEREELIGERLKGQLQLRTHHHPTLSIVINFSERNGSPSESPI